MVKENNSDDPSGRFQSNRDSRGRKKMESLNDFILHELYSSQPDLFYQHNPERILLVKEALIEDDTEDKLQLLRQAEYRRIIRYVCQNLRGKDVTVNKKIIAWIMCANEVPKAQIARKLDINRETIRRWMIEITELAWKARLNRI